MHLAWSSCVLLFLSLALRETISQSPHCNCVVSDGTLVCIPGSISKLPLDLELALATCEIDPNEVFAIELLEQSLTELPDDAFPELPNLFHLAVEESTTNLTTVNRHAFRGLNALRGVFLKDNGLEEIAEGALDHLFRLNTLDVRGNPSLTQYVTTAWHFCHGLDTDNLLVQGDINIYNHLESSPQTGDYCQTLRGDHDCLLVNSTMDCRESTQDMADMACFLMDVDWDFVLWNYEGDEVIKEVDNYFEGEASQFFQEFNSQNGEMMGSRYMRELVLYGTKFDLSTLPGLTSELTREVEVKADTVHLTGPITLPYWLNLRARVVSLDHTITFNMTRGSFYSSSMLEAWAHKEEVVRVGPVYMRIRKQGLMSVLDEDTTQTPPQPRFCNPLTVDAEVNSLDIQTPAWYDPTVVNLQYVCARTVQGSGSNPVLVKKMADFYLGYVYNRTLVGDGTTFMAAQKFKRIQQIAGAMSDVHNVPSYSTDTITSLSEVMYNRMLLYRTNEISQEEQLMSSMARVQDMQLNFGIVQQQQELYFQLELDILNSIWDSADTNWHFSFDHRNGIEDQIGGALDGMMEQMFEMQEQELEKMLIDAENSLEHIQAVINKYKDEIMRFLSIADASTSVQMDFVDRLKRNAGTVQNEVENFEDAVEEYKHEQEVKAAWGIFKAFVGIFVGFAEGYFDPEAIGDAIETAIEGAIEIAEILAELIDILESVGDIQDMIDGIDLDGLSDIGLNLGTDFKAALHAAVDLKKKGPRFDDLKNLARTKLDAINHEIDATDLMMAIQNLADVAQRLTEEVSEFADNMLLLAERNDEIKVANSDKERAVEEIAEINRLIEELKTQKQDFEAKRQQDKDDYENELKQMEAEYDQMTEQLREEYRQRITAKFEQFKASFSVIKDGYLDSLSGLTNSIQRKSYGLKEHSMLQRSMLLSLYTDYCDAKFYHAFQSCSLDEAPLMADNFDILLQKLSAIQWETITSTSNLPGTPIKFGKPNPVWLELKDDPTKHNYPIQLLKNNRKLEVNLKDYDNVDYFDKFWRIRIDMIRLVLMTKAGEFLPSPGSQFGEDIQVLVTYPTLFNDKDADENNYLFLAQNYICTADYTSEDNSEPHFHSQCQVDDEFSDENYKPSSDAIFTFFLTNADRIDMDTLDTARVEFSGSFIPHYKGEDNEVVLEGKLNI